MNRLEMAEQVAKRVPMLAKRDKDEWQRAENLRVDFVADYPINKIASLALDDYVIGKGSDNRSFCYRLEREMDTLGRILGANAFKFGVYFGRTKSNAANRYRFASHWGSNLKEAFASVKQAIVDLLLAAAKGDSAAIADNALSPMFKGKLLFLYNPKQFAPFYSEKHLEHFVTALDLTGSFKCGADMQRTLMEYRATWPDLVAQPAALYMRFLYDLFDYPSDDDSADEVFAVTPLLDEALKGAEFIVEMPAELAGPRSKTGNYAKPDYEAHEAQLKRIGDRGEAVVVALEKRRLIQAGKHNLAARIRHVSQDDDKAGFDILSFDEDGTDRPIEVKATNTGNLDRGFYISINELEKASKLANYYIYFVFSAMSKQPRVLPMKQPALNGGDFVLRPLAYHVTLSASSTP